MKFEVPCACKALVIFSLSLLLVEMTQGQTLTEHLPAEKKSLYTILEKLKNDKQVTFLYEPNTIKGVSLQAEIDYQDDIITILKQILPPVGLRFRKIGKYNFVIKKDLKARKKGKIRLNQKPGRSSKIKKSKSQPYQKITGFLSGAEDQQPLIGATVHLKNAGIGTTTNTSGWYQLEIPTGQQTLIFSYIGFETQEIEINGQKEQNVRLKVASTCLDEVIVTAVGIEANKRILGYAADNFDMEELSRSGEDNLVSMLSANSAGVWTNTASGSPGASATIFIRGLRSVNGSNKPLFILDGMPIDNTTVGNGTGGVDVSNRLVDLNYHDIDKVTILKGAAATALYGIRAANGAVVMTSKKGLQGRPKVRFSSTVGLNTVNKLPPRQSLYAQGKYVDGQAVYLGPETNTASSYGPLLSNLEFDGDLTYPYDVNGRLVPQGQGNGMPANIYDPYATFFVKGQAHDNHLAVSGGTNWFDYYFSFGQFLETGVVPRSTFERYSLNGAFNVRLGEKWQVGMSTNLAHSEGFRMKRGSQFSGIPLGLFRNPSSFDIGNGKSGKAAAGWPEAYMFENGRQRAYRGNSRYDNPFWSVNRNPFVDKVDRIIQQFQIDYQLTSWLKASYKMGLDHYIDSRKNAYDIHSGTHRNGQVEWFDIQSNNINSDFLLSVEKQLAEDWFFQTTLGHNYFTSFFSIKETIGDELKKQGVYALSNTLNISSEESLLQKKVAGVFADLHLRYKNILYLNFTGRNDWSSTLPQNNNAFFYPSFNFGFEFSELFGWSESAILSFGKLRFSIGKVGNDANAYLTNTYFNPAVVNGDDLLPNLEFPAFGVTAFERSGTLGNAQLRPETTDSQEFGADVRFFKSRLSLDVAWYKSINRGQIINAQITAASGFLRVPTNGGTIKNQGFEATLKVVPVRNKNFRWTVGANFSKFESIVTELPNNISSIVLASFTNVSSMVLEGQPYGVLVGTSIKRDEQGRQIIGQDGFPIVNQTQTIIGDPNPDWLLGIRNVISWKRITLKMLLDIRKGGDIWNGTLGVMNYLGISKTSADQRTVQGYVFEGVTESGEPNTTAVDFANPANGMEGVYWRRYGFIGLAENHVEDASWLRLRQVNLAYSFSPNWFRSSQPEFTISLNGHNVVLFTKYSGVDPETNLRGDSNILGWDYFNLPSTKGWSLQLKATF